MLTVAEYFRSHQASQGLFLLKVLKIILEKQYPTPFLSFSPYQRWENLSQALHVPGEEGVKGHDPSSSDFNCLFRCYLSKSIFQVFYIKKSHLILFQEMKGGENRLSATKFLVIFKSLVCILYISYSNLICQLPVFLLGLLMVTFLYSLFFTLELEIFKSNQKILQICIHLSILLRG